MGQRQQRLKNVVSSKFKIYIHPKPESDRIFNSKYADYVFKIYTTLGGILKLPPTRFGSWDISTKEFIIELDEVNHFNRYRFTTLQSNFYSNHKYFSINSYKAYCEDKESDCLKSASWGKYWKNDSTEKQFGYSNTEGILVGNGSSRWKQRSYYDFLKDVTSHIIQIPLIRISIYDLHNNESVDSLLKSYSQKQLIDLIETRIENIH